MRLVVAPAPNRNTLAFVWIDFRAIIGRSLQTSLFTIMSSVTFVVENCASGDGDNKTFPSVLTLKMRL